MSKLRLIYRSFVADYCLLADFKFGQPPTAYLINHGFLASRGIIQGMVIVARSLLPMETPPDNSLCLIAIRGEVFLRRVKFGPGKRLWLEDDRECREFKRGEVTFSGVALYACSCELNKSPCTPTPLSVEAGLRVFRQDVGMMRWHTDARGYHLVSDEMRTWITLAGGNPDTWAGWGWIDFLHPEDKAAFLFRWSEAVETGKPYLNQGRICVAGMWLWMVVSGNPVRDATGRIVGWEGFSHFEPVEKRLSA